MNRWSVSQTSPLKQSRFKGDGESHIAPNNQPAHKIRQDEQPQQLTQKDSPISENRSRIKSSYDVGQSGISQKYEKTETSYSPIIKSVYKRDISPQFQKSDNFKLIDSFEVRLLKLSQENGALQSQMFQDQQKYNQIIIDFELQTKSLEQKLQTEIMSIQQHKLLIQSKNEEINSQTQELLKLEQKYFDLESKVVISFIQMFSQQKEMGFLRQQNESKTIEIDNLRQYIKELQAKNLRDQEEQKLAADCNIKISYELQIKDIQAQHGANISRLNELVQQEQQKYNRLLVQYEQLINENSLLNIKLNDSKLDKDKILDENQRLMRQIEDNKFQQQELVRESEVQRERLFQQDKSHQNTLNDLKSHYEYMKKSQVEREIKEFTIKFQAERLNYDSQIRSLNQRINELEGKHNSKYEEARQLSQKLQAVEQELRVYIQDHDHYKRIKDNELQEMQNEALRVKQLLNDSQQKNQHQQQELLRLNQLINDFKIEMDLVKSQSQEIQEKLLQDYTLDVNNLKENHVLEIRNYQEQLNEMKNSAIQQEQIMKNKDESIHSLKLNLSQKQGEVDNLLLKLENLEKVKNQEIADYQGEIEEMQRDINNISNKSNTEKNQLEQLVKQLKQKVNELETQQIQAEFGNEQSKQELDAKLKQKDFQLQQLQNEKHSLQQQMQLNKEKVEQLDNIVSELRELNIQLSQEVDDLKQSNESDRAQFVKKELGLENKIQQLKQQLNQRESELQQYSNELDDTQTKVRQQELITQQSQDEFKRREHQYVQEITNLKQLMDTTQQRQSEYQSIRETLQEQVQSLQEKKDTKEKEVEEQYQKYEELRDQFNTYVEEMNYKLEFYTRFETEKKECDLKYQAELNQAEDKIKSLEIQIESMEVRQKQLLKERRELEDLLDEKSKEIESLKSQLNQDYISNEEYQILQAKHNDQTEELHLLEQSQIKFGTEKKQLERQIDKLHHDLELKDQELHQIENLMKKRRGEQEEQNRKQDQLQRELSKVQHDNVEVQAQLATKNDQINALKRENEDLQIQITTSKKQLDKTQEQLTKKNQELIDKANEQEARKSYSSGENATKVVVTSSLIKTSQIQLGTPLIPEEDSQKGSERSQNQKLKPGQKNDEF